MAMRKLKLTLDTLHVETFGPAEPAHEPRGTVRGNASDSTCMERVCGCAPATDMDFTCSTCDHFVNTCHVGCETQHTCPTMPGYLGC
jgi:hypothetical protein